MNQIVTTPPFSKLANTPFQNADAHNFGRFVSQVDCEFIHKPRSIFWEWLFLGSSPIRSILNSHNDNLFGSLPLLIFKSENYNDGIVEVCSVNPVEPLSEQNLAQTGAILGLMSYFGITDLHKDNMVCGNYKGQYIFSPLDIESVFDNVELPAQTLLLPSRLIDKNRCGLNSVLQALLAENGTPDLLLKLSYGYVEALDFLSQNSTQLLAILDNLITKFNPLIRRVLRPTKDYYTFLNDGSAMNAALDTSETVQLLRGDIPYFFKYTNSNDVFFYLDENLTETKIADPQQFALESTIKNLNYTAFGNTITTRLNGLSTNGILQILRLIPADTKQQQFKFKTLSAWLTSNEIIVETNSKTIKCRRSGL